MRRILIATLMAMATVVASAENVYTIYPVPQSQKALSGVATFTSKVCIVADPGIDEATIARAESILAEKGLESIVAKKADSKLSNLYLGVDGSKGPADKYATSKKVNRKALNVPGKYDRHVLLLTSRASRADVLILGENTDATFCGLASLEQILDCGTSYLACVSIEDYADIRYRGVIEGYYGVPYNAAVTKDLFRFMARYKMNCYMYGAKSDPYHSQKWAEPYPETITPQEERIGMLSQGMLRDIVAVSHQCKVNFIWAIHPGNAFIDPSDDTVIDRIMGKYESMYELGVRQFGIFVDDVGVPHDDASLRLNAERLTAAQNAVEERWNRNWASPADTVKPINFVPQLYAYSWVKEDVRKRFHQALGKTHPNVLIYITGAAVWTVPNNEDPALVSSEMGRSLAWWWNYPCNDNDVRHIFVRDTYTNFADMKAIKSDARLPKALEGVNVLIANPMQQGSAARIPLFGVGDYGWNNAAFDNEASYQAALKAVAGANLASDLDFVTGYLRHNGADSLEPIVAEYKASGDAKALRSEMLRLLGACRRIEEMSASGCESDSLFIADIRPWLWKVSDMAFLAVQLLDAVSIQELDPLIAYKLREEVASIDSGKRYEYEILTGMGSSIDLSSRTADPAARVLRPLLDYLAAKL